MDGTRIAIVGIALRYPDANSPAELWRNVLAGRRAFRRLPDERMRTEDYYSEDPAAPDRHYARMAAVLDGFEFDRVKYRISGSTFRSTDMTHWLALDTTARALDDAGFPNGDGVPRKTTGVIIGNTLNGEFSRTNLLRLRWPYVRRTVASALRKRGWEDRELTDFLSELEGLYKNPFAPITEDSLAGGLSNTIAGRICNYFDLGGGGFTVDGACSSSLLSVATACDSLTSGQIDIAIAGGVDLSIDPFEVVGFAKTGTLATAEMKVYDRRSNGFWPGEGCGMLVLMRDEDAQRARKFRYATIAGWGYSSDGKGGITRPEASGHRQAMSRAYKRAGFGFDSVQYVEGHGTATIVGDATELRAFSEERRAAIPSGPPLAVGTVKGNFGHTKAAAGVAGLIKAVLAVRHQVIPPATSHYEAHPVLAEDGAVLRVPDTAEVWPAGSPVRAGVSSMGFGGINAHIVVEHADGARRMRVDGITKKLVRSRQDTELLLLDANGLSDLSDQLTRLAKLAARLSFAELGDLSATLAGRLANRPVRAAVVARSPEEAAERIDTLLRLVSGGACSVLNPADGVFLGNGTSSPRIAFLFTGQGAGRRGDGGALRRRFAEVDALFERIKPPAEGDLVATSVAQPRIVTSSVAGLRVLSLFGIEAAAAAGHSLGELTALHWAGAMSEQTLLDLAAARGRIMEHASAGGGAMAGIAAEPADIEDLLASQPVVIAGFNGPAQTVISGPSAAIDRICQLTASRRIGAARLNVSHAFHSPAVAPAASEFRSLLERTDFTPPTRTMFSTVTGDELAPDADLPALLTRQITEPVRFSSAVQAMATKADLFIEVGPGHVLEGLATAINPNIPAFSIDADSMSLTGLFATLAAAFVLGAPLRPEALTRDRYIKPMPLDKEFRFLANPCEAAPTADYASDTPAPVRDLEGDRSPQIGRIPVTAPDATALDVLRTFIAKRAELPVHAVSADTNPIDELHLSSITVGQIVGQTARELGLPPVTIASAFATSTVADIAQMLEELSQTAGSADPTATPVVAGAGPWVRAFKVDLVSRPPSVPAGPSGTGDWDVYAPDSCPLASQLAGNLREARLGGGVLLCLPNVATESHVALMLAAARAAAAMTGTARFVTVGGRRGAAGLAKTLCLESPNVATTVVVLADGLASAPPVDLARKIMADVAATSTFSEVHYDDAAARSVPVFRALPRKCRADDAPPQIPLTKADVLLTTGGGKGITAECALALSQRTGASVAIIGRSDPETDDELAGNLERLRSASVPFTYVQADVVVPEQVKAAVAKIVRVLGPVTAVLHGAGHNEPRAIANLDEAAFRQTLAPKIAGLEAVLTAVDPAHLKVLIAFGSIIGRAGLRGEGDYATANDWLADLTTRVGESYPECRCLCLEWSVWSGVGMGERLGALDALVRDGITPIGLQDGIDAFLELLADQETSGPVVVTGRADMLPTITLEHRDLPLLRFVDRPRVHIPGVELVVEADLSAATDPYLTDHQFDGELVVPAVIGIEAMAQAGAALTGEAGPPTFEGLEFSRPIVVPANGQTTIRIAVLASNNETVRAVIRSSETGFQVDHFHATLRYPSRRYPSRPTVAEKPEPQWETAPRVSVDPLTELYGPVLFQGGRFRHLLDYRKLSAKKCVATISTTPTHDWFAGFLPADLLLADPGVRDALMHSMQCCVPDATLLPVSIERLWLADPRSSQGAPQVTLHGRERSRSGDTFLYDLDVCRPDGSLIEQWRGLRLHAVKKRDETESWLPPLLGPYLEHHAEALLGTEMRLVVDRASASPGGVAARRQQTAVAISKALGRQVAVSYRTDGRPLVDGAHVSSSHGAGVTFAAASDWQVACDVETVIHREYADWAGLLSGDAIVLAQRLATTRGEGLDIAATRVWGALETMRKSGQPGGTLTDTAVPEAGPWAVLRCGTAKIASFLTRIDKADKPAVFTIFSSKKVGYLWNTTSTAM